MNYNVQSIQIQSIEDLTKSSSNWFKQKAPSRTLISCSKTSVVQINSQLIKLGAPKMRDQWFQVSGEQNALLENAEPENAGPKLQEWKIQDLKKRDLEYK